MLKCLLLFLSILFLTGCVDTINLKTGDGGLLVVDGWITNQPGPYKIKLSRSIPYDNTKPLKVYSVPESKATILIMDNAGNSEVLKEFQPGIYQTTTFAGTTGRSYQIKFQTADGNSYTSDLDELKVVPDIDSIKAKFQISTTLIKNANGSSVTATKENFAVYANVTDPASTRNFYRWQAAGVFEFYSITDFSDEKQCWAPAPDRLETGLAIASDEYFDGHQYQQYVGVFPYDRPTMYLITLTQQSITEAGYNFFKKISNEQTSTGTLFDPPPNAIKGNIHNDNNATEEVLGFFGASAVTQRTLLVNRFVLAGRKGPTVNKAPLPGFCRFQEPNATNIKWPGF